MKVLIIEDNPLVSQRFQQQLRRHHIVEVAHTGHDALAKLSQAKFDLALLDLGLPDMPGIDVCRAIRKQSSSALIMVVSGVSDPAEKIKLLQAGADDYLTKPCNSGELGARITALGRRRARLPFQQTLTIADLIINPEERTVTRAGVAISLRRKEFDILEFMARQPKRVHTRAMILAYAWNSTDARWNGAIDVHMKHLRDKIEKPFNRPLIRTIYGVGYVFINPDPIKAPPNDN